MLKFYGPLSALQKSGFFDTGSTQIRCHYNKKTNSKHILEFTFKTFIPSECRHPYAKRCMDCEFKGDCEILRTRTPDGRIGHRSPESIYVEGFSTEDSNPDQYLLSLIKDYVREI